MHGVQVSFLLFNMIVCLYDLPRNRTPDIVDAAVLRKCFLTGGNSTLRQHCRKHYEIYKEKCEEANVPVNHHAIPPKLLRALAGDKSQTKLDKMVFKRPETFTREGLLHTIAQFVACDDQVRIGYSITRSDTHRYKLEGFCCRR